MLRFFLWILAGFLLVAVAVLVAYLVRDKQNPVTSPLPLADAAALASLVVNLIIIVFTAIGVWIALASYKNAMVSGDQQLASLEASRKAMDHVSEQIQAQADALREQTSALQKAQRSLESQTQIATRQTAQSEQVAEAIRRAAEQMHEQRDLLAAVQGTLKNQLALSEEQHKRDLELLSRKPEIKLSFQGVPTNEFATSIFEVTVKAARNLRFDVSNVGTETAIRPITIFVTDNPDLKICAVGSSPNPQSPNRVQISGIGVLDLEPFEQTDNTYCILSRYCDPQGCFTIQPQHHFVSKQC